MNLLKYNADHIVKEVNSAVGMNINFMNEQGIIIASTDPERIGQIHEGARAILEKKLDELLVKEDDDEHGVKEGANYPIVIGNEVVGVIGITGDYEQTAKLGKITKKMTEILMTELTIKEHRQFEESQKNRYIMEWTSSEAMINKVFVERGKKMNIDITVPRRFMLLAAGLDEDHQNSLEALKRVEQVEERIKNYIRRTDPNGVYMKTASTLLCGVSARSDEGMREFAENIITVCGVGSNGTKLTVGIDGECYPYRKAKTACDQAQKALRAGMRSSGDNISFYKDINMEIFMDEISAEAKREYIHKLFKGYDAAEIEAAVELLSSFYDKEGSITEASQDLHMHKNTLQYKLRKIYERTGRDPRMLQSGALFQIAIEFFYDMNGELVD